MSELNNKDKYSHFGPYVDHIEGNNNLGDSMYLNAMQPNSIEAHVQSGITELQTELQKLADAGNTVAQHWLAQIQQQTTDMMKLVVFGEMRVKLINDISMEAELVYKAMWSDDGEQRNA